MKTCLQLTFRDARARLGLACALSAALASAVLAGDTPRIRRIELVHLSHTDVGFTDHPSVSRDLHARYLDIALDAIAATRDRPEAERFRWTAESTLPVHDWWPSASDEEIADASLEGTRKEYLAELAAVPLLIVDDLGMRKLPHTAAENLLELVMRRYERTSTMLTSNRPVDDRGKLLGDTAAVTALLDRLLHHAHVLKCGPKSWRTKTRADLHLEKARTRPRSFPTEPPGRRRGSGWRASPGALSSRSARARSPRRRPLRSAPSSSQGPAAGPRPCAGTA